MSITQKLRFAILVFLLLSIASCASNYYFRANYYDTNSLLHESKTLREKPYLKAHLKNGDVCILKDSWELDTACMHISGSGLRYDFNRYLRSEGPMTLSVDSISLFETNTKLGNTEDGRISGLGIVAGLDILVGILCLTNPKACFGSCPTFYLNENDQFHYADAEGFSNAITPSMEYRDIDALKFVETPHSTFSLTMKNEALETHCLQDVRLMAVPLQENEQVFHSPDDRFLRCKNVHPLRKGYGPEGDISNLLKEADYSERYSPSDSQNLSSKEEIILEFGNCSKQSGLNLHFRQSLMTTYFIYSAMGFMGDQVSDCFNRLETEKGAVNKLENGIKKELGNIELYQWDQGSSNWKHAGNFHETGPIAINKQVLPLLPAQKDGPVKIKIVLNKGLWRLDYAAVCDIIEEVKPIELTPRKIFNKGKEDPNALRLLQDDKRHLISMPGSSYRFEFQIPEPGKKYALFLSSEGYYLEWMREHWFKDKDLLKLATMIEQPKKYLKDEAAFFKQYENVMEQEFWDSRIDTKNFSYHAH